MFYTYKRVFSGRTTAQTVCSHWAMPGKTVRAYKKRGSSRRSAVRRKGIYSTKRKTRSNNAVRKIARKAAKNVLKEKRPVLHRRFNLDANQNGYETLTHNTWQHFFTSQHATGYPFTGGLAELANQNATQWPEAPQQNDSAVTRLIPLCEEPGYAPGRFRTHRFIEDAYIKGQITFTQYEDRCGGMVRIIGVKYRQGLNVVGDDVIMQTNCSSTAALPSQNLYDAPIRPPALRTKHMQILFDKRIALKGSGGALYGGPDTATPVTNMVNGETVFKFTMKLPKRFDYGQVDGLTFDADTAAPSKWNYGFLVCAYGGNGVAAGTNICEMTYKGDLCFRNPV